ncbi:MAG: polysaccharide biosynthesis/export family protein [Candidatus Promineifilaceae bacterium]
MTIRTLGILILLSATLGPSPNLFAQDQALHAGGYQVLPGDTLRISVWKEPDLQLDVLVRPDSAISFPLAGEISTKGLSVGALQQELSNRLGKYISNPVVTVTVLQVLGNKVYVIGQVNNPGVFVVNPNVDVMQALSMAGGITAFASSGDIRILRRNEARQVAIPFDYNEVLKGKNLDQNIVLQSGDIVVVP